jgi:RNA polymerase sigma-70 factor (ECF subfamily)
MKIPQNNLPLAKKPLLEDEKMFEFIFKVYFPRLLAFARKFVAGRSEAEDIIQEIFLKVWMRRKEIEEDTLQSYLFTLVRNACLNQIKHQKIVDNHRVDSEDSAKEEIPYYADFFSDPYHQTIFNEMQNEIETVVQNLPEQTRKIFQLSRFKGMKNSEIAKMMNISIRTVEKHNTRALQRLKTHLSTHYLYAIAVLYLIKELNN